MHDRIQLIATTIVRHIPEWFPWFSYKPLARVCYSMGQEVSVNQFGSSKKAW